MISSTIWQVDDDSEGRTTLQQCLTGVAAHDNSTHRADAGYIASAVAGALTIVLMLQRWLTASGPNGRLSSDAFGRIDGATGSFTGLMPDGDDQPEISGVWAILAVLTAVVTITAVVLYLRNRGNALSLLVLGSATATAIFILADLLYLSGKTPELRAMVEGNQGLTSGLLGMFLGNDISRYGTRQIASAGLSAAALLAGATAFGGAVAAIATAARGHIRYAIVQRPNVIPVRHTANDRIVVTLR